ncbi:MAG: N-glycosylase/DNA lyase [Bacteroidota bacterium]
MKSASKKTTLDELISLHRDKRGAILQRLDEFARVPPEEYFYEFCYCLLTPQSSAVNAAKAVSLLRARNFINAPIDPEELLHQKEFYIRFHKTKAKHLLHAKENFPIILAKATNGGAGTEIRKWLVENVKGMGWKEASHFLRNIGYKDLAILDRHILKNLLKIGVLRALPKTLTPKLYGQIEKKFQSFSREAGIPMDEFDLLFWSMETGEILK